MRLLRIVGNTIYRRLKSAAILVGCCDAFWQDLRAWDDACLWPETYDLTCDSETWVNSDLWKNECLWVH